MSEIHGPASQETCRPNRHLPASGELVRADSVAVTITLIIVAGSESVKRSLSFLRSTICVPCRLSFSPARFSVDDSHPAPCISRGARYELLSDC